MSTGETYTESVRPSLATELERRAKVWRAVEFLRDLISKYAEGDEVYDGKLMQIKEAYPNQGDPEELSWVNLYRKGKRITAAEFYDPNVAESSRPLLVDEADFVVRNSTDLRASITAFTITTEPHNVMGHDGEQLSPSQIDGVMADLERYRAALETER